MGLWSGMRIACQRFQWTPAHQQIQLVGQYYVASDVYMRHLHSNLTNRQSLPKKESATRTAYHRRPCVKVQHHRIHSTTTPRLHSSATVYKDNKSRPKLELKIKPKQKFTITNESKLIPLLHWGLSKRKRRQALALFEADLTNYKATRDDCEAVFNSSLGTKQQMSVIARIQSHNEFQKLSSQTFNDYLATLLVYNRKADVVAWRLQMAIFGIVDEHKCKQLENPHCIDLANLRLSEMERFVQLDTEESLEAAWELFDSLEPPPPPLTSATSPLPPPTDPTLRMFATLLKACLNLEQREVVLEKMKQFGLPPSTQVFNMLLADSLVREGYDGFQTVLAEMEAAGVAPVTTTEILKGLADSCYTSLKSTNDPNTAANDLNKRRNRVVTRSFRKGVVGVTEVWRLYNLWLEDAVKPNFDVHIAMLRACTTVDEQLTKIVSVAAVDMMSPLQRTKFFRRLLDLMTISGDDHATVVMLRMMSEFNVDEKKIGVRSNEVVQDMQFLLRCVSNGATWDEKQLLT
eukprot:m.167921 g.167921  ORF g.167921 m.167921 type:complete len:518 (-) comp31480_c0_seq2:259-1812(-)